VTNAIDKRVAELVAIYEKAGLYGKRGLYPTAAQWKSLLEYPHEGKFYVASVFTYSADPTAAMGETGIQRHEELLKKGGIKDILNGLMVSTLTGEDEETRWEVLNLKEIPSKEALIEMMTNPELMAFQKERADFVQKQRSHLLKPYD
jgi:hypothetical protein